MPRHSQPSGDDLVRDCRDAAHTVLTGSIRDFGWAASSAFSHYDAVWTRDAAFTTLGALEYPDPKFLAATRATIQTLVPAQGRRGQMPAAVWPDRSYWDWGEAGATDASCLFVVMLSRYLRERPDDTELRDQALPVARRALTWVAAQDANNFGLLDSPEASDWMDSTLNRSGKVLYNNVVYYAATAALAEIDPDESDVVDSQEIVDKINLLFWPEPGSDYNDLLGHVRYPDGADLRFPHVASRNAYREACVDGRGHYLSHVQYARFVDLCDVLANSLAVLWEVAGPDRARRIASYLSSSPAMEPYPARCYEHPVTPGDDAWQMLKPEAERHQDERWRNPPGRYHNGGVWPFVGGFCVAALAAAGLQDQAEEGLRQLAAANRLSIPARPWGFHEWIASDTGLPGGAPQQAWSAAAFLYAAARVGLVTTEPSRPAPS